MILVSTGTNGAPFDRLLRQLDGLGQGEEMLVQHGPSAIRPHGATCVAAIPFHQFVEEARRARVFVTHAGVGSILVALMTGHRPILVPRLQHHREAVDDHQLDLSQRLAALGAATLVTDTSMLAAALHETAGSRDHALRSPIANDLAAYLDQVLRPSGAQPLVVSEQAP